MSVAGVTKAARTAVAKAITKGGITCLPYDTWTLATGSGVATLGALPAYDLTKNPDQSMRIRSITFDIISYQLVDANIAESVAYSESSFEKIVDAIGADITCEHHVVSMTVQEGVTTSLEREDSGVLVILTEIPLLVELHANMGS